MRGTSSSLLLVLVLAACGRASEDVDVKMVGVGYDPDEIGPVPTPYGGLLEYDWLDFAGGGLSLGFSGLLSFDPISDESGFYPPYALIYGFGYIFDVRLDGAVGVGTIQPPPAAEDACYTSWEATGPIGSFTTTDAGTQIGFTAVDGSEFRIDRVPTDYPPDPQDMFIYYSAIETWRPMPGTHFVPGPNDDPRSMTSVVYRPANFPFGQEVAMSFPGGVALEHAPVGSLPLPSSAVGDPVLRMPFRTEGLRLAWEGRRYAEDGALAAESGPQSTCVKFYWPDSRVPAGAADCVDTPEYSTTAGQIYTGPWDTEDGKVTFEWTVPEAPASGDPDTVTLSVRLLGPVDREDNEYLQSYMVNTEDPAAPWMGREALACEEGTWVFDPTYVDTDWLESGGSVADGPLIPSLQGDPLHTLAEVTCRLQDDGSFDLTNAMLENAMDLGERYGAEGAVFYFTRTSALEANVPDVKDAYDNRRPISPVLVNARTIEIGRFWFGEPAGTESGEEE